MTGKTTEYTLELNPPLIIHHPVLLPFYYEAIEVDKHPDYFDAGIKLKDIEVIKLKDEINTKSAENLDRIRSICLPEKYVFNKEVEFVITACWGYTNTSKVLPL